MVLLGSKKTSQWLLYMSVAQTKVSSGKLLKHANFYNYTFFNNSTIKTINAKNIKPPPKINWIFFSNTVAFLYYHIAQMYCILL